MHQHSRQLTPSLVSSTSTFRLFPLVHRRRLRGLLAIRPFSLWCLASQSPTKRLPTDTSAPRDPPPPCCVRAHLASHCTLSPQPPGLHQPRPMLGPCPDRLVDDQCVAIARRQSRGNTSNRLPQCILASLLAGVLLLVMGFPPLVSFRVPVTSLLMLDCYPDGVPSTTRHLLL